MPARKLRREKVKRYSSPKASSRVECSLGVLTKHFLDFVAASPNGQVDLNAVVAKFNVRILG